MGTPSEKEQQAIDYTNRASLLGWAVPEFIEKDGMLELLSWSTEPCDDANIIIPDFVDVVGESAFERCYGIKTIKLGSGVKKVKEMGLSTGSARVKHIELNEGLKDIGKLAFRIWYDIEVPSITIPTTVETVGPGAVNLKDFLKIYIKSKNLQTNKQGMLWLANLNTRAEMVMDIGRCAKQDEPNIIVCKEAALRAVKYFGRYGNFKRTAWLEGKRRKVQETKFKSVKTSMSYKIRTTISIVDESEALSSKEAIQTQAKFERIAKEVAKLGVDDAAAYDAKLRKDIEWCMQIIVGDSRILRAQSGDLYLKVAVDWND